MTKIILAILAMSIAGCAGVRQDVGYKQGFKDAEAFRNGNKNIDLGYGIGYIKGVRAANSPDGIAEQQKKADKQLNDDAEKQNMLKGLLGQ